MNTPRLDLGARLLPGTGPRMLSDLRFGDRDAAGAGLAGGRREGGRHALVMRSAAGGVTAGGRGSRRASAAGSPV